LTVIVLDSSFFGKNKIFDLKNNLFPSLLVGVAPKLLVRDQESFMLKPIQGLMQNLHQPMISPILKLVVTISFSLLLVSWKPTMALAAPNIPNPSELSRAVQEIENLDVMRSGLAASLEGRTEEPTMQTMQEVCRPVGMRRNIATLPMLPITCTPRSSWQSLSANLNSSVFGIERR
jgi:hypothetical protein